MLIEFQSLWGRHLGRTNVARKYIKLLNDEVTPVHFASYQAGLTARSFVAAEINGIISEKVIEPAATGWWAPILFDL